MKIEFNTDSATELNAVAALIASLGGTLPTTTIGTVAVDVTADIPALAKEAATEATEEAANAAEAFAGKPPSDTPSAVAPPPPTETPASAPASPTAPAASPSNGEVDITAGLVPSTGPTENALMNSNGVEVDKAGLPYDARIHTKKPKIKKDGFWTLGRGVDKDLVRDVVAELKQVMAAGGNDPSAAPAVAAAPTPAAEPVNTGSEAAAAATAASPPPVPTTEVPAPPAAPVQTEGAAPPTEPVTDFAGLMKKVTGMQTAGKLDVSQTSEIAVSLGLTGIKDLIKRPDLVAAFDALLPEAA